eukprot:6936845-Pyramimonas_sp.AAC.1
MIGSCGSIFRAPTFDWFAREYILSVAFVSGRCSRSQEEEEAARRPADHQQPRRPPTWPTGAPGAGAGGGTAGG